MWLFNVALVLFLIFSFFITFAGLGAILNNLKQIIILLSNQKDVNEVQNKINEENLKHSNQQDILLRDFIKSLDEIGKQLELIKHSANMKGKSKKKDQEK